MYKSFITYRKDGQLTTELFMQSEEFMSGFELMPLVFYFCFVNNLELIEFVSGVLE